MAETKNRRTKADIDVICDAIMQLLTAHRPMTNRQLFYRLETQKVVAKTENEYKNTVTRLLVKMRRDGRLPYGWLADNTRWMRKPDTWRGPEAMLHYSVKTYRHSVWENQDAYVEIWLEKDALAGVLMEVTDPWDVPLMVTRGYPSLTFLNTAAEAIAAQEKPAYLYYFGDYDPSGMDITRKVEEELRAMAPHSEIHFERVAVTPEQIELYDLPTRPTKTSDSRSKNFGDRSVEVDAIPPDILMDIAQSCIVRHVDEDAYIKMREVEAMERRTLDQFLAGWRNANSVMDEGYIQ
jgi:hypothetical protein